MTELIHPTAIIDKRAELDSSVRIGAYSIIGADVQIAQGTVIEPHVVIAKNTKIGSRNHIFPFASIGADPQDLKYNGEETYLVIGDDNRIRESCSLHRGTAQDKGTTQIGNRNLLMVNTHLAHDCMVGDDCILANNVGVAGHVTIGDFAILGGNSGVHQFCQIGAHAMVGGGSTILKDVPAFVMASGNPSEAHGINIEGLKRRGFSADTINTLRDAFKVIYKQHLTTQQALEILQRDLLAKAQDVQLLIDSLLSSKRGIVR